MSQLGTLEELPLDYRQSLEALNLVPLWPNMRAVLPYEVPSRNTKVTHWGYGSVRPLLMQAGELTPMEKAERRVLVLANPGHGLDNLKVTPSIYMGLQLILPHETAPNHLHTPNAVRVIIEGEGAWTTVAGEPCIMKKGDLILTPSGEWHEHHHEGEGPIVWLDILDLPIIYGLEGSWAVEGTPQSVVREYDQSFAEYSACGIVPSVNCRRTNKKAPQLRYPWEKTQQCLLAMANHNSEDLLRVSYINPETGGSIFPTIDFAAIMLRPKETVHLPKKTTACVYHVVQGEGKLIVDNRIEKSFVVNDCLVSPGYTDVTLVNTSVEPTFIITADESPLHHYLSIF